MPSSVFRCFKCISVYFGVYTDPRTVGSRKRHFATDTVTGSASLTTL